MKTFIVLASLVALISIACTSLATPTFTPQEATLPFPTPTPAPVAVLVDPTPTIECAGGNLVENESGVTECIMPDINAIVAAAVAEAIAAAVPTATPVSVPSPTPEPTIVVEEPEPTLEPTLELTPTPTPIPTPTPEPTLETPVIKLPRSAQDILKNGGFEQGKIDQQWVRTAVVPNWNISGTVDVLRVGFPKCEGEQSLDLNGSSEASINQGVRVVPGEYYILRFTTTLHAGLDFSSFDLYWDGQLVENIEVDTRACKTYSYLVASADEASSIRFQSTSNNNGRGVILDNIRLLEGDRFSARRRDGRFQGTDINPPEDEIIITGGAGAANVSLDHVIIDIDGPEGSSEGVFNIKGNILDGSVISSIQIWHSQDDELRNINCTTERPIGIVRRPPTQGLNYTVNEVSYEWTWCPVKGSPREQVDQVPYIDPITWQINGAEFVIEAEIGDDSQHLSYTNAESVVLYFFDGNSLISRNFVLF